MSGIDWSKAPESATGAMLANWAYPKGKGHYEFVGMGAMIDAGYAKP